MSEDVTFAAGYDVNFGFLTLTAAAGSLTGTYISVTGAGVVTADVDAFTVGD